MTVLVVHDTVFGNTAEVAETIADELAKAREVRHRIVSNASPDDLADVDLLIVGSPTRGFRPTPAIQEYLAALPPDKLNGLKVAAFDTRIDLETVHPAPLRWVVDVGGYAANVLQTEFAERHCVNIAEPAGFLVTGTEGPLKDGELDRARQWAQAIAAAAEPKT